MNRRAPEPANQLEGKPTELPTALRARMPDKDIQTVDGVPAACVPGFLTAPRAAKMWDAVAQLDWQTDTFKLFGRIIPAPRRTAWVGDAGVSYRYTGLTRTAEGWPACMEELSVELADLLDTCFNFALLNRYAGGEEYVGWHADDERGLGVNPVIAVLSLGGTRRFKIRTKKQRDGSTRRRNVPTNDAPREAAWALEHGSLLLMWGDSQTRFEHCVPRTRASVSDRVSISFRNIVPPEHGTAADRGRQG